MTSTDKEARAIEPGDILTAKGSVVTSSTYDSARNAYRIEYVTTTGAVGVVTIPANDLVAVWS